MYDTHISYVGSGAAGFGERERTVIFQEVLRRFLCDEKLKLVFRLDFLFLFHLRKKIEKEKFTFLS